MYLTTLTDDELLRYAGTLQLTPLETELVSRMTGLEQEVIDVEAESDKLKVDLANSEDELDALKALA